MSPPETGVPARAEDLARIARLEIDLADARARALSHELVFERAPVLIHRVGADGLFEAVNDEFVASLGYTRDEILGRPSQSFLTESSRLHAESVVIPTLLRDGVIRATPLERVRRDGTVLEIISSLVLAVDLRGRPGGVIGISTDVSERRRAERELADAYRQLQLLSRRFEQAREDERRHIAHELHDELGQQLTAIQLQLEMIANPRPHDDTRGRILDALQLVKRGIGAVRELSRELRPALLDELGLGPALRAMLEARQHRSGVGFAFEDTSPPGRWPAELETAAYRIVQEATTNVLRHANARHVLVTLESYENGLCIRVTDDGRGFDTRSVLERLEREGHLGLLGLRERARMLAGRVRIESSPESGTTIEAWLPGSVDR